ncbi:recombinase RecT [Lactococcus taiwanensis]|uniref:recombinase RecT n=1 Tax=Lactococcus taiwanensis TaxID=1151742 RepID=UPI00351382B0
MTEEIQKQNINNFMKSEVVQHRFKEVLGKKANGFISSLLTIVNNNNLLKEADPNTIMTAAMKAAALDLPIEPSLGFAYVVPYNRNEKVGNKWIKHKEAQFQIGYKGLIQLALRSGQLKNINSGIVYEEQFVSYDPLFEELELDFTKTQGTKVKGYFASVKLINGFEKVTFWTKEEVINHGKRFSKSYGNGPWKTDFDAMAQKTVLKAMISKYVPLSQEMQMGIVADNQDEDMIRPPIDVTESEPLISIGDAETEEQSATEEPDSETQGIVEQNKEEIVEELFPVGKS